MAISKKGLRKVVVDEKEYLWKFEGNIKIFSIEDPKNHLVVDFGWYDVWGFANDPENRPPDFEPKIVTPKFITHSIHFALENGWKNGRLEMEFRDGVFTKK